jgi:hypothetical protein
MVKKRAIKQPRMIIGRAERVDFPRLKLKGVPAKIDTGADISAIWASNIKESERGLTFNLFGKENALFTGEEMLFEKGHYSVTRVANSFGERELRYAVKIGVRIKGRLVLSTFTLANREDKTYPILLGRRLLSGKFLVDVKAGEPLSGIEREKKAKLKAELSHPKEKV